MRARGSPAMTPLLRLPLGSVMALVATLPCGEFDRAGSHMEARLGSAIEKAAAPARWHLGSE